VLIVRAAFLLTMSPSKLTPFSDPLTLNLPSEFSPHYKPLHRDLRRFVRNYVETELAPYTAAWEAAGRVPEEIHKRHAQLGFAITFPLKRKEYLGGMELPGGVPFEDWDGWCNIVVTDEFHRQGYAGPMWALGGGSSIGCPPIANFGTEEQRVKYLPKVARGELRFCLGITEPDGGSDVARISTTARKVGDQYIVNGSKKWITNGMWADYCTAAVRTGGPGKRGISLLIIPLNAKGVMRRSIENSGVNASGSAFLSFDDVSVPVSNLIGGEENKGFAMIMSNFNPERLGMAAAALRLCRVCAADAYAYACERETFGAPLITRQSIRHKIAKFGQLIEPTHAFMEQLVFMLETSKKSGNPVNVGGMTALLKVMSTAALEKCVREAQQIMGGAGYSKTGKGARIEQISRDMRVYVVGGGSIEIMKELAVGEEAKDLESRQKQMAKL
jgi:alkylation response protein AidB-like acyl-CoA dehydrogenase